ncbi:MAG: large repetitive protein [Thermoanaerobaculia bacterium]|nr:large repetitive protein [Thermoanaerobaculia bacterium]
MNVRRSSLLLLLCFVFAAQIASAQVVISQVYGGGGNAGATYKNDFIEIFNRGTSPQSLTGWSVQYASSAGSSWQVTNLTSVTLAPGQYYLIQESAGTGGTTSLPTPDASGGIAMSATAGKVALVSNTTALTCGATNNCPAVPAIVDLVGFGAGTSSFEGAGPTGTLANTTAAIRASSGCTDTNNNAGDFAVAAPTPRNTATALHPCSATTPTLSINNVTASEGDSGTTTFTFTVSLSGGTAPPGGVTFNIATADGSATTANNDYVAKSLLAQSVTTTYTFTVSVNGDINVEPNETFNVNVSNIVGATNSTAQGTGTIVNDDSPTPPTGTGSANPSSLAAGDTTTLTVNVTPGAKPTSTGITVTADLASIGGSVQAMTGSGNTFTLDATVANGTTNGNKTIPITISDAQGRSSSTSITLTIISPPPPANHVVISQVYGGGGNSGATYANDFVELYNPTNIPFDLTGWTIQYASAAGTAWNNFQTLGGTIGPGQYYLISLASGGATGDQLPAANVYGSINMSGTTGKIALVRNGTIQSGTCPISSPNPDVVDFVGYGPTASCSEGNLSAPTPSNTTADIRKNNGGTDTDINRNDFVTGTPNPRRTAIIAELGPSVVNTDPAASSITSPHDGSLTVNFSEAVDTDAGWYNVTCNATGLHNDATTAHTTDFKSWVITPNTNFQFGENCTVTINKNAIHDQDTDDSGANSDTLFADYVWSFTVVGAGQPAPYPPSVHLTMGNPTSAVADVNQPNNYLMEKPTYATSYNRDKGTPNWVSWHLDSSWYGSLARVDTFRPDPAVPPDWYRVQAFDYSLSGFDRGHMTPNADRDNENRVPINQETYLMANMVPQAPDNNQGPWANMENDLRTIVAAGDMELYIVSGPAGVGGTGSNGPATTLAGGHITVPAYTWKAVLVLPKGDGDVSRVTASTRTIAVIMPNVQGIRNNDWHSYLTTVDAVESLCACNLFSNVPAATQNSIEAGVNGVNPPGAADQTVSTNEDTAATFTFDTASPNNAPLTYTIVTSPSHGTLSGSGGSRTYTPAPDFNGSDSFTYRVNDGSRDSNTATVSLSVIEVNDAPTAADDAKSTDEDTTLSFNSSDLTANDSTGPANESGQQLNVTSVTATASTHGNVSLTSGTVSFIPDANYFGPASFTYRVCDNGITNGAADPQCATATVNVTVNPVNDPPTAADDAKSTDEDTTLTFSASDLTANDSAGPANESGQTLTVTAVSATANTHGTVSLTSGNVTYVPEANYNGAASFTYSVCDNGTPSACSGGTVTVTVNPVNDPPTAADDSKSTDEDTTLTFATSDLTANDSAGAANESGQSLTVTAVTADTNTHGTVSLSSGNVTYVPEANYNGPASFTYRVCDDGSPSQCANATVNVTVNPVNDPPTAADDAKSTDEDTTLTFASSDLTANDSTGPANESGQSLTVTAVSATANTHGTVSLTSGNVTYVPEANYNGAASFTYSVCDDGSPSQCANGTVNLTVNAVNDPPTAADDAKATDEDTTLTFSASDLTANDSAGPANESGQSLTVTAVDATANTHGTVSLSSGNVTYVPEANYNGTASFTYRVCDNGSPSQCANATVNVTVNPVNDPPTAADDAKSTNEDTTLTFASSDLTANDSAGPANESGQSLTVTAVTATANTHGTVSLSSGNVTYTPEANYNGPASFTYRVCDNGTPDSQCATAAVNVTVNAVNDSPTVSITVVATSPEGTAVTATASVSDPDANESFTYAWTVTKNGSPYASGSGTSITFTPNDNGAYTVSLTVTDTNGATGSDAKTDNVTNVAPTITSANLSSASIDENGSVTVSGTFTDPGTADTHTVTIIWGDGSANSSVSLAAGAGSFSLAHQYLDDAPSGTASDVYPISVIVTDDDGGSASAGASVTVKNVAPAITSVTGPSGALQAGSSATITVHYTDIGSLDTHTAVINWDDGSSSPATCASGTCTASHTYAATGVYTIGVSLSDDDTGNATATYESVVVVDANGGFITGGGWIDSPAGAYVADPTAVGKSNFSLNAKYQKGQSTPTGNSQFQLKSPRFDFSSTTMEWLVVAGDKAQYKGSGTVNGSGDYGFLITATDGHFKGNNGVDKFRIKVWNKTTGVVLYDNVMGASSDIDSANPQAIGGGSVTIH